MSHSTLRPTTPFQLMGKLSSTLFAAFRSSSKSTSQRAAVGGSTTTGKKTTSSRSPANNVKASRRSSTIIDQRRLSYLVRDQSGTEDNEPVLHIFSAVSSSTSRTSWDSACTLINSEDSYESQDTLSEMILYPTACRPKRLSLEVVERRRKVQDLSRTQLIDELELIAMSMRKMGWV